MEYTKDTMPDGTIYERCEGTPEEIIELMNGMNREESEGDMEELRRLLIKDGDELVYNIDEAVEYIDNNIVGLYGDTKVIIREMLELEEAYMRIKGIIED